MRQFVKKLCVMMLIGIYLTTSSAVMFGENLVENDSVVSSNEYIIEQYSYPITPDDEEWNELGSVAKKIAVCRIPEDILTKMTNEALVKAVLDFPFVLDIYAYSSETEGVLALEKICDAYAELLNRENSKDYMVSYAQNRIVSKTKDYDVYDEIDNDILAALILFQVRYSEDLTESDCQVINELSSCINYTKKMSLRESVNYLILPDGYVYTPKNSPVGYITYECSHGNEDSMTYHAARDGEYAKTYNIRTVSIGTCRYNCHSYAWYSRSAANTYWIPNPSPYMTDGSYSKIISGISTTSISVNNGDIVIYGTSSAPTHSAVVNSSPTGVPLGTRNVISKWGALGVFEHSVANVPSDYDVTNMSVWR